jgi:hypothetical protein
MANEKKYSKSKYCFIWFFECSIFLISVSNSKSSSKVDKIQYWTFAQKFIKKVLIIAITQCVLVLSKCQTIKFVNTNKEKLIITKLSATISRLLSKLLSSRI